MKRMLLTTSIVVAAACVASAQATPSVGSSEGQVMLGCLAQAQGGFVLRAVADEGRRSGGSSSAKSSTPVGGAPRVVPAVDRDSRGSSSAKASAPLATSTSTPTGRRTGGMTTAKGSVAIAGRAVAETALTLDDNGLPLAQYVDQWVEITTAPSIAASPDAAQAVRVERVRVLSSTCAK